MKRFVALLAAMSILLTCMPMSYAIDLQAANRIEKPLNGCNANTPVENVFKIEGDETEFILLKTTKNDASKYFVMTKRDAGSRSFDPDKTQRFDPSDENNIAHWLNNGFLTEGGSDLKLPQKIIDNINKQHSWNTEPGNASGNAPESYSTVCGVSIISVNELIDCYKNFGIRDEMDRGKTATWTRTPYGHGTNSALMMVSAIDTDEITGKTYELPADTELPVRPVFYLGADFFKNVKIQARTAGRNVKQAVTSSNGKEAALLNVGYTADEIKMLNDTTLAATEIFSVEVPGIELTGGILDPTKSAYFSVSAMVAGTESKTFNVYFSCEELGVNKTVAKLQVEPSVQTVKNYTLKNIKNGDGVLHITVMDGDRVCKEASVNLRVMPAYKNQFMDQYAERSVSTQYLKAGQSNEADTYMLQRAGVKRIQESIGWNTYEPTRGSWTFENADKLVLPLREAGMDIITGAMASSNPYTTYAATSSADITNYASKYLANHFTNYGKFNQMEIWNEPNLNQNWAPNSNAYSYMNILKVSALEMKKYYEDTDILASAVSSTDADFVQKLYDDKAFAYMDYVSYHPYILGSEVDQSYRNALGKMNNVFLNNGGWKEGFVTGVGWTTAATDKGNTEAEQANETIKMFVVGDSMETRGNSMYTFKDSGDDDRSVIERFGAIKRNATPKKLFYALTQVNLALGGGIYVGEMHIDGNINAHVYMKDHEPVVVIWTTQGETAVNYDFGQEVAVVDSIGNKVEPVSGNTYAINREVYYVTGVGKSWFTSSIGERSAAKVDKILGRFEGKLPAQIENELNDAKQYFNSIRSYGALPSEGEVSDRISSLYGLGTEMLTALQNKQTELSEVEVSTFLYMLQLTGEGLIHLYQASITSANADITSTARLNNLYDELYYASSANYDGTLVYSNAMFRYARRYSNRANDVKNTLTTNASKTGIVLGYDRMANEILDWTEKWMQFEKITHTAFNVEIAREETIVFEDQTKDINVGVRSYSSTPVEATLNLYSPDGRLVKESDTISVAENSVTNIVVPITFSYGFEGEPGLFTYELVAENGEKIDNGHIIFTPKDKLEMKFEPHSGTVDTVKELTVNLKNLYDQEVAGTLTIEPCEGWEFSSSSAPVSVAPGETATATFKVSKTAKRAFNYYTFNLKMIGTNGKVVLSADTPLSFLAIVKNTSNIDAKSYRGDAADWADAYPIFINPPKNAMDKEAWKASDISATAYMKWDDENFYVLANVYDDSFVQTRSGGDTWANDSMQLSLDTMNTKSDRGYDGDDYEIGAAYTPNGKQVYSWTAATTALTPAGQWSSDYTQIIRDEGLKLTRYLLKLPARAVNPLALKQGTQLGLNIALNDADVREREAFPQFTSGTADGKNPSLYKTFTLVAAESAGSLEDVSTYNLPVDLNMDWVNSFASANHFIIADVGDNDYVENVPGAPQPPVSSSMFSDVTDHWAKSDIEEMARKGIVSGVGGGRFEPDRQVTRAEFISLLAKSGIEASQYQGSLTDVNEDHWFAGYVQTGIDSSVIPAEMVADGSFRPDQPITREEMACMIVRMYEYKAGLALEAGGESFSDQQEFSPWTVDSINAAANAGIVKGISEGVFGAKANATRAESVTILKRLLGKI